MTTIDRLSPKQMINNADAIDWNGRKLEGVVLVLESLEAPLVDQPLSATLFELRQLLESMRKVLQVSISIRTNSRLSYLMCMLCQCKFTMQSML